MSMCSSPSFSSAYILSHTFVRIVGRHHPMGHNQVELGTCMSGRNPSYRRSSFSIPYPLGFCRVLVGIFYSTRLGRFYNEFVARSYNWHTCKNYQFFFLYHTSYISSFQSYIKSFSNIYQYNTKKTTI